MYADATQPNVALSHQMLPVACLTMWPRTGKKSYHVRNFIFCARVRTHTHDIFIFICLIS